MADKKITQLTPIVGADLVSADEFVVVDVSADETKSIVLSELIAGIAALPKSGGAMTGAITTNSTFDGRDVATDGTKLDTIEANADVTDTTNVTAAGALMDSELTNIAAVKALNQSLVTTSSPTFDTVNATTVLGDGSGLTNVVTSSAPTGSGEMPSGTTAQRDVSPSAGYLRFNSTNVSFEGHNGSAWGAIGGGATGGGNDAIFYENGQTVTTSYAVTATTNAMSAGPITINAGATVTVDTGGRWVVL